MVLLKIPPEFHSSSHLTGFCHVQHHLWCMDFVLGRRTWILFSAWFWLNDLITVHGCLLPSPLLSRGRKVLLEDKVNCIFIYIRHKSAWEAQWSGFSLNNFEKNPDRIILPCVWFKEVTRIALYLVCEVIFLWPRNVEEVGNGDNLCKKGWKRPVMNGWHEHSCCNFYLAELWVQRDWQFVILKTSLVKIDCFSFVEINLWSIIEKQINTFWPHTVTLYIDPPIIGLLYAADQLIKRLLNVLYAAIPC